MLSIKNLSIKDYQHDLQLIENLSFTLNEGDKIAIIGMEGSGKSTLLKVIRGDTPTFITIKGEINRPRIIAYLEQNIKSIWNDFTVFDYLVQNSAYSRSNVGDISKLFIAFKLSYEQMKGQHFRHLSGGEAVKIGLINALLMEPDALLLDEPSNDIDFKTLVFLEAFLKETSIPTLFISHDQTLLSNVATGIIHLQQLQKKTRARTIFLDVDYSTYKQKYLRKYDSDLMIARKQRADYEKKMEKFRQIYQKVEYQQNQAVRDPHTAQLLKKRIHVLKSQERRYLKEKEQFVEIPEKEEPMSIFFRSSTKYNRNKRLLELVNYELTLNNGIVIQSINLTIMGQDKIVITGDNGCGKTTLIDFIYRQLISDSIKVGYLSQDYLKVLDDTLNPVQYLMIHQSYFNEVRIRQILGTLGLRPIEMTRPIHELSEGTKLKVLLLLLSSNDYDILLLDEPTRNISPINLDEIYDLFTNFQGAILAVTHDRSFIEATFDDIYELSSEGLMKR